MNCFYHPDRSAVQRCEKCGQAVCQECSLVFDGRSVCKACVKHAVDSEPAFEKRVKYPHARSHNLLIVFLLSMCPGVAHMYMGLMKRGLLILSSFFLSIWLANTLYMPVFLGLFIAAVWIVSFFDAINTRKRIISGEYVDDCVSDITGVIKRFKIPLILLLIYAVFYNSSYSYGYGLSLNRGGVAPVVIFAAIFAAIFSGYKKKRRIPRDEPVDKRYEDYDQ